MRKYPALFILILLISCPPFTARAAVTPDDLGEQAGLFWQALDEMELEWYEFSFDMRDFEFYNDDKYRLNMLDAYFENPWKVSPYTRIWTNSLLASVEAPSDVLVKTQSKIGQGIRNNIGGYDTLSELKPLLAEYGTENLAVALATLSGGQREEFMHPGYEALPDAVRDAAALFCLAAHEAIQLREVALTEPIMRAGYEPQDIYHRAVEWTIDEPFEVPNGRYVREEVVTMERLLDTVDFSRLNAGAMLLAHAVQELAHTLREYDNARREFEYFADTPFGLLILRGAGDTHYAPHEPYFLVIDCEGDDRYEGGAANLHYHHPVSVVLDLAGNDTYAQEYEHTLLAPYYDEEHPDFPAGEYFIERRPCFGAGVLGYGILADINGDDTYDNQWIGQGAGVFGTGVLWDLAGNDRYAGIGALQGSGTFGTGILADAAGNDSYDCYVYSQGYGFTGSAGLLLDGAGNDRYTANNNDIVYDGPHSPVINLNMSQGFGYGRRDDLGEGHSWMGGLGMLVDGGGDDDYDCGIYALGSAYWGGIGILTDKGGDDHYMSAHYTLAAPPHYAIGILQDDAGNDTYYGYLRQAIGHGRDWSLGWFEDSAGDDWYQAGHQSIGQGDVNSIGVFWEKGGNDTYLIHGPGFGQTTTAGSSVPRTGAPGSIRWFQRCIGLFIDGGGNDRYLQVPEEVPFEGDIDDLPADPDARNNHIWDKGDSIDAPQSYSVGIDAG
jgi:hypothetical protein